MAYRRLSREELAIEASSYETKTVENPLVQVTLNVSFGTYGTRYLRSRTSWRFYGWASPTLTTL
jgi:hypothetical protein